MEIDKIIKKYKISQESRFEHGKINYTNRLRIDNIVQLEKDDALDEIKEKKEEILKYFADERNEKKRFQEERQQKIAAIEGLVEIKAAYKDMMDWQIEFNKSFNDVGGLGIRPKPEYDIDAMLEKYPVAAAFLEAEGQALKQNDELSIIGSQALEQIIYNPEKYAEIIDEMHKEIKTFVDKHLWD